MMKTQLHTKPSRLFLVLMIGLLGLLTNSQASAEEATQVFNTQTHISSDGLAIQQPMISQPDILKTLTQAHKLLSQQGQQAQKIINENDSGKNIVIAAIMPGGLLYLAYQKNKVASAKTTLTEVSNELANLDEDAVTLYQPVYEPARQPIVVARYP